MEETTQLSYTTCQCLEYTRCVWVEVQDAQPKDAPDGNLPLPIHLQLPDKGRGQIQDGDIEDDIRDAADDVHDRVIDGGFADRPIADNGPDLKERGEEESDEPGDGDDDEVFEDGAHVADGEDAAVEVEDGEFDEGDGEEVEELEDEEDLGRWIMSNKYRWRKGSRGRAHFEELYGGGFAQRFKEEAEPADWDADDVRDCKCDGEELAHCQYDVSICFVGCRVLTSATRIR